MHSKYLITTGLIVLLALGGFYVLTRQQAEPPAHDHADATSAHHEEEEGHTDATVIAPEAARTAGIKVAVAQPAMLRQTLPLTGKIILNPETTADIQARFPGIVRSVRAQVGQQVAKGSVLATVESNDSLQTYAVISPLAGVVTGRHASVGDATENETMFTVANLTSVVAEFHVFTKDMSRITIGQTVQIMNADQSQVEDGTVVSILPVADAATQSVLMWVKIPNAQGLWRPGMAVQGAAVITENQVPLAVTTNALQSLEGQTVVFVQTDASTYQAQPVTTGQTDGTWTQITHGLQAGARYVSQGSFIIKADLGKAGAAHEH